MNTQKKPGIIFLIFKYAVLSLYVIIPILAFLIGTQYQEYTYRKTLLPLPLHAPPPSVSVKQQPPSEEKITIRGIVDFYGPPPEFIADAPMTLHVSAKNGVLYDILLPSGESSCPIVPERNDVLGKLQKGDSVEMYGRAATNHSIMICFADEYIRILNY